MTLEPAPQTAPCLICKAHCTPDEYTGLCDVCLYAKLLAAWQEIGRLYPPKSIEHDIATTYEATVNQAKGRLPR